MRNYEARVVIADSRYLLHFRKTLRPIHWPETQWSSEMCVGKSTRSGTVDQRRSNDGEEQLFCRCYISVYAANGKRGSFKNSNVWSATALRTPLFFGVDRDRVEDETPMESVMCFLCDRETLTLRILSVYSELFFLPLSVPRSIFYPLLCYRPSSPFLLFSHFRFDEDGSPFPKICRFFWHKGA